MCIYERKKTCEEGETHSVSSRYFSHLVTYWTYWKRFSCSLCIIRTMTFELESSGSTLPLGSQVSGVREVPIIAPPADGPAEMGKEQKATAFILCCQAVGLWKGAVVGTGGERTHIASCPRFHILEEKIIWLLRIKRQPTSQCLVLQCRPRRKCFWKGNDWSHRSPVDTPSVDAMFSLPVLSTRIGDEAHVWEWIKSLRKKK